MTYKLLEKNIEKQILSDKDAMIFFNFSQFVVLKHLSPVFFMLD